MHIKWAGITNSHSNVFVLFQFFSKYLFGIVEKVPPSFVDFFIEAATAENGTPSLDCDLLAFFNWDDKFCFSVF